MNTLYAFKDNDLLAEESVDNQIDMQIKADRHRTRDGANNFELSICDDSLHFVGRLNHNNEYVWTKIR